MISCFSKTLAIFKEIFSGLLAFNGQSRVEKRERDWQRTLSRDLNSGAYGGALPTRARPSAPTKILHEKQSSSLHEGLVFISAICSTDVDII